MAVLVVVVGRAGWFMAAAGLVVPVGWVVRSAVVVSAVPAGWWCGGADRPRWGRGGGGAGDGGSTGVQARPVVMAAVPVMGRWGRAGWPVPAATGCWRCRGVGGAGGGGADGLVLGSDGGDGGDGGTGGAGDRRRRGAG
ncbi:hypothetical protein MMRN_08140 [Mycobacterium marinum]|nr:hypothetical protein MMRN_08140 [Mycobacterium marinum]